MATLRDARQIEERRRQHAVRPIRDIITIRKGSYDKKLSENTGIVFCTIVYQPDIQGFRGNCDNLAEYEVLYNRDCIALVCDGHRRELELRIYRAAN